MRRMTLDQTIFSNLWEKVPANLRQWKCIENPEKDSKQTPNLKKAAGSNCRAITAFSESQAVGAGSESREAPAEITSKQGADEHASLSTNPEAQQ